jgi:peroxiredoxin family protein/TusA-related sulfurtransferase
MFRAQERLVEGFNFNMQPAKEQAQPDLQPAQTLDCRGMQCPAPILELSKAARGYGKQPTVLEIIVDDRDFPTDLRAWCRASHNALLSIIEDEGLFVAHVGLNIRAEDKTPSSGPRVVAPAQKAPSPMPGSLGQRPLADVSTGVPANTNQVIAVQEVRRQAVDCRGMQCPAPILAVAKKAQLLGKQGGVLEIVATDEQFPADLKAWCRASKAQLINVEHYHGEIRATVAVGEVPPQIIASHGVEERSVSVPLVNVRGNAIPPQTSVRQQDAAIESTLPDLPRAQSQAVAESARRAPTTPVPAERRAPAADSHHAPPAPSALVEAVPKPATKLEAVAAMTAASLPVDGQAELVPRENRCTILIIKNDFESLMAAMMCASTAAAQGMETSIFFSFWGVNVLRGESPRRNAKKEKVSFLQRMMQWMMPRGPARQKMSKMHMGGMGKGMMEYFMRKNNVLSLEELVHAAAEQNVKFIVCAMSMGIMGIQKRDIVDMPNVEFAGVATFVELSRRSAMTMVF